MEVKPIRKLCLSNIIWWSKEERYVIFFISALESEQRQNWKLMFQYPTSDYMVILISHVSWAVHYFQT